MKTRDEVKDIRTFGIGLSAILFIIGSIQFIKAHLPAGAVCYILSGLVLASVFFSLSVLKPVYKLLKTVGHVVTWINIRILLVLLYYLIVTPIGLLMRLLGKNLLELKICRNKKSYWVPKKNPENILESYEQQF